MPCASGDLQRLRCKNTSTPYPRQRGTIRRWRGLEQSNAIMGTCRCPALVRGFTGDPRPAKPHAPPDVDGRGRQPQGQMYGKLKAYPIIGLCWKLRPEGDATHSLSINCRPAQVEVLAPSGAIDTHYIDLKVAWLGVVHSSGECITIATAAEWCAYDIRCTGKR